jgi:hypothetical protein
LGYGVQEMRIFVDEDAIADAVSRGEQSGAEIMKILFVANVISKGKVKFSFLKDCKTF